MKVNDMEDIVCETIPYTGPFERLPHGPHDFDTEANQRTRIIQGLGQALRSQTIRGVTVAQVIGFAGVSRRAFYEHFSDKHDCFKHVTALALELRIRQEYEAGVAEPRALRERESFRNGRSA